MIEPIFPYTIVEIGSGPLPFPSRGARIIDRGQRYIGLDVYNRYPQQLQYALDQLDRHRACHQGLLELISGDGTDLQFPDQSLDELIFCNVFGTSLNRHALQSFIAEAHRKLKKRGFLTVVETYTPSQCPIPTLKRLMALNGPFAEILPKANPHNIEAMLQYSIAPQNSGYALVFQKAPTRLRALFQSFVA